MLILSLNEAEKRCKTRSNVLKAKEQGSRKAELLLGAIFERVRWTMKRKCCVAVVKNFKGIVKRPQKFLGTTKGQIRRHSGAKKLFVILHGKRKAELVPTW